MLTLDYRCSTKCYVLFIELVTREGTDVVLTEHCKSKVISSSRIQQLLV